MGPQTNTAVRFSRRAQRCWLNCQRPEKLSVSNIACATRLTGLVGIRRLVGSNVGKSNLDCKKFRSRVVRCIGVVASAITTCMLAIAFTPPCAAAPGALDGSFGDGGRTLARFPVGVRAENFPRAMTIVQGNSEALLLAGTCAGALQTSATFSSCYVKFHADGTLDAVFGQAGRRQLPSAYIEQAFDITASGGDIFSLEFCYTTITDVLCVRKMSQTGVDATNFGLNGKAQVSFLEPNSSRLQSFSAVGALLLTQSGSLVVGGGCGGVTFFGLDQPHDFCLMRLTDSGSVDRSFGEGGLSRVSTLANDHILRLLEQSTGHIVAAGLCHGQLCLARFTPDGQLDLQFGLNGWVKYGAPMLATGASIDAALALNDAIVAAGPCGNSTCVVKLDASGGPVASFGSGGVVSDGPLSTVSLPSNVSVAVQRDQKVLLAGSCPQTNSCVVRLHLDGTVDAEFTNTAALALASYSPTGWGYYFFGRTGLRLTGDGQILFATTCEAATGDHIDMCVFKLHRGPYDAAQCALNADANKTIDPATDALLITRFLLGYRGDALTTSAVGASPTRTNAEIETYLGTLMQAGKLDVDGDGQSLAMTDGLLLIRAMLGLSGTALTNGATNAAHPNVRNAQQVLTWIESMHGVACLP